MSEDKNVYDFGSDSELGDPLDAIETQEDDTLETTSFGLLREEEEAVTFPIWTPNTHHNTPLKPAAHWRKHTVSMQWSPSSLCNPSDC